LVPRLPCAEIEAAFLKEKPSRPLRPSALSSESERRPSALSSAPDGDARQRRDELKEETGVPG
jgi:hypothetical protein